MNISIAVKGTQPLLLHKYTVASVSDPKARMVKTRDSNSYVDEWRKGTYTDEDGLLVIPHLNIMACLFDGAKGMKIGKKAVTRTVYTSLVISPVKPQIQWSEDGKKYTTIHIDEIPKRAWLHTSGAVVMGRRIDRIRTMIPPGWVVPFNVLTKDDALGESDIRAIVVNAGKFAGMGDWRPSSPKKPGPYGVFEVVQFDVTK